MNSPTAPHAPLPVATLAAEFHASRERTLALLRALLAGLGPGGQLRYLPELSPPLWDLGHLAWAESWWVGRHPGLMAGALDNAAAPRAPEPFLPRADAWFDDRRVNHPARWHQPLPPAAVLLDYARRTREKTLSLLPAAARRAPALLLFQRALEAEQRLHEDWLAMAQTLGIDPGAAADDPTAVADAGPAEAAIDAAPVTWARYLAFVDDGGYERRELWSDAGWEWRKRQGLLRPRHLAERETPDSPWRRARFGRWVPLDAEQPAMHLSAHEAEAWCRWAGRRLPTEGEWRAAQAAGDATFRWGEVWEWVAADEDGGAPRLVGASFATAARLRAAPQARTDAPERNDGFSGLRSCRADAA
jgi:iron(II)-dependent oxidoreductase